MKVREKWKKGFYQIVNNEKYKGKRPVIFRSSLECSFMKFCDLNPNILEWSSESVIITYFNPVKNKVTRYYPDFVIKYKDKNGGIHIELIEIKPYKQTIKPVPKQGKKKSTLLQESKTYAVNCAKWEAAMKYCEKKGIKFRIITEKDIRGKIGR